MSQTSSGPARILRVIARLNTGGPAQHVALLTARLGPPRWESHLAAGRVPANEGDMGWYATAHGVEPIDLPHLSREIAPVGDLRSLWQLWRLMRRLRPTVVHTHTAKAGFVGRVAAWLAGVPVVVHTYHGHVLEGYFGRLKTALFVALERVCGALSSCVVAVSPAVGEGITERRIVPPRKMRVVELGLELQRFADAPRRSGALRAGLGLGPAAPLVGFCGRLVPIKNVPLFLEACARVHAQRPEVHFALIGDGELRAELEALAAQLGLSAVAHFVGWQQDMPAVTADLDLLVLTSRNEGTPVAVLEASAAGVPAVATRVGGVPTIVTDGVTGWLVDDGDLEHLARAMAEALADPAECARRGRLAQDAVLARFDVARLARDIEALYDELLAARRR